MQKRASASTTAQSLGALWKSAHDIMRKDKGLNGDLGRFQLLTWIMFLRFLDDLAIQHEGEASCPGLSSNPSSNRPTAGALDESLSIVGH